MPQVDLETLVSVCAGGSSGDRKIACETLADGDGEQPPKDEEEEEEPDLPPDFPPESFWLSKDAEFDWFDRKAFYERKDSTKGNSNSTNLNPSVNPASNSSSQRFSMNLKSKAAIIGLPKTQKASYVDTTKLRNCKPANTRLFPKQSESVGKSAVPMTEPSSPKVSCMGRVRSKRGRRKSTAQANEASNPAEKSRNVERKRNSATCGCFPAISRSNRKTKSAVQTKMQETVESQPRRSMQTKLQETVESPPRRSVTAKAREFPVRADPAAEGAEPPGLGGMMRFASGRRSASWGAEEMDFETRR